MKQKIFYKVVRYDSLEGSYVSCKTPNWMIASDELKALVVLKYSIGKETAPLLKKSKIMVFDSLERAQAFRSGSEVILQVVGYGAKPSKVVSSTILRVEEFWKASEKKRTPNEFGAAPKGTVFVSSVIPIQEVS